MHNYTILERFLFLSPSFDFEKMKQELDGKTVLITGASSGIGKAFAYLLADTTAHLILVARSEANMNAMKVDIEQASARVTVFPADLRNEEERTELLAFLHPFAALLNRLQLPTYNTVYIATPIYHGYGIAILLSFLALGKKVVIQERFDAKNACALIRQHQVEVVTVVPLMVHKMLKQNREALSSLACIASGGAKLSPVLVKEVNKQLWNVLYNLYGTSEAGLNIIATPEDLNHHPNTLGKAIPGSQLQVVADGKEVESGRIGQFCIRNEWSMTNSPHLWIQTGDIGYRDENGYYFLCGRTDDLIISAGNNIYPSEIEATLCEHPSIEDVAVIGVEDAYAGHMLKAYVQLYADETMTEDALLSWLRTRVATYQIPREIAFVKELPYTPVGKLDRKQVQTMARLEG